MAVYNFVMIAVLIILINIDYDDKQKILNNNQPVQKHLNNSSTCIWSRDMFYFSIPGLVPKSTITTMWSESIFRPQLGMKILWGTRPPSSLATCHQSENQ